MQLIEKEIKDLYNICFYCDGNNRGRVYIATTDTGITKVGATQNVVGRIHHIKEWFRRAGIGNVIKFSFSSQTYGYFNLERHLHYLLENYKYKHYGETYTLPYEDIKKLFYKAYNRARPIIQMEKNYRELIKEFAELREELMELKKTDATN